LEVASPTKFSKQDSGEEEKTKSEDQVVEVQEKDQTEQNVQD